MELEWETRPLAIAHQSREWTSTNIAPSSFATSSNSQRRRSSVVHTPPVLPPPSHPIPSVPVLRTPDYDNYDADSYLTAGASTSTFNGAPATNMYARPNPSAGLAAVAAFSQARQRSSSETSQISSSSSASTSTADNLSDSPPPSMLRSTVSVRRPQETLSLLQPPEPRAPGESRPSSRRALTKALELAREAVALDSTNDDPHGAIIAYGKSVALLQEVMGRVMRGEDSTESNRKRNGRRRSVVAQEEEVKRLKSIHDTYAERMNILSLIYNIPPPTQSLSSISISASTSTDSTQPPSPASNSPSSDSSDPVPRTPSLTADEVEDFRQSLESEYQANVDASDEGDLADSIGGAAIFALDTPSLSTVPTSPKAASSHPYANVSAQSMTESMPLPIIIPPTPLVMNSRSSNISNVRPFAGRSRASSTLPPPAPPPMTSPPPAPVPLPPESSLDSAAQNKLLDIARPRGNSAPTHKRTPSANRLSSLREENEKTDDRTLQAQPQYVSRLVTPAPPRDRDSHPLPPLPSPSSVGSPNTVRNFARDGASPVSPTFVTPKPHVSSNLSGRSEVRPTTPTQPLLRVGSNLSMRSDASASTSTSIQPLINSSTTMGTISKRRSKVSAPPSTTGSPAPPEQSVLSSAPSAMVKLPTNAAASLSMGGRSRSSSQPGRRPSLAGGQVIDYVGRPPMPATANSVTGPNGTPRKTSMPSKLNPLAVQPLSLSINTALLSPPLGSATLLVPPPPIPHANIPTTPTSPLPPAPPNDASRKPYHLMDLLQHTMMSKSGGYITRRLHVPQEVWSQGGVKLPNLAEKVRVVEVLCSALEDVEKCSAEFFGAGNVSSGLGLGIGSVGRKEGEAWSAKLEEFSGVCDSVVANFGKKLGVGEGFALKKTTGMTSWGGKLTRQFDKFTNGKNLDSPTAYVQGLSRLFTQVQLLDEHTKAISSIPVAPTYAALPADIRAALDVKLKHSSDFFARVVLTFVIRDLSLLLDKYAKKCEKWLAE